MKKKKVLFQSDFSLAKTGFGRNAKAILEYLHKTGKYEITQYCCGQSWNHPELQRTPWRSVGTLPDSQQEMQKLQQDPNVARDASYGAQNIDKIVKEFQPDVYFAVQDIWGIDWAIEKKWFKNISSVLWTTLDSVPILPSAVNAAAKVDNLWVWSNFAEKELHKMGHKKVRTMHGAIETEKFFRLPEEKRASLRNKFNIQQDEFVIGFLFRNQLRKSVPNLIEGYSIFKRENPKTKTKLLLHTHFGEGWNILKLCDEYKVDKKEIITTQVCRDCGEYEVSVFSGQEKPCKFCGSPKGVVTTQPGVGVSEEKLNEVYNLMDIYCHPITSGGQEIPIQEAKLTELITLVTNYSCGEEMCEPEAASLPLDYAEYREHGTEFIKASTYPSSIAKQLKKALNMKPEKKIEMGKRARKWVIDNFSIEVIGKAIEDFIDQSSYTNYDFSKPEEKRNPFYQIPHIENDSDWLIEMYRNILKVSDVDEEDDGHKYWMQELKKGVPREKIEEYFRQVARKENSELFEDKKIEDFLGENQNRILFVVPRGEDEVFNSTALLPSIKAQYPDHDIYFSTNQSFIDIVNSNPFVYKFIPYSPVMQDIFWAEGRGEHNGYFDICYLPTSNVHENQNFTHNGKDVIQFDIKN